MLLKIGMNKDAFTDPNLLFCLQKEIEEKSDHIMTSLNSELVQACPVSNVPPQKQLRPPASLFLFTNPMQVLGKTTVRFHLLEA